MTSIVVRFLQDVKSDKSQAVKANLLSNSGLATAVHPVVLFRILSSALGEWHCPATAPVDMMLVPTHDDAVQNGQTALQVAVQSAGESVIRALRRNGARWTDVDNAGNNAVHYIARAGRADLCKTRKSADWVMALHQPNADGETPLHATLSAPDSELTGDIIQAFVHVGADINRRNGEGKSALDLAGDRLHLIQVMHQAASSALGNVATPSHSVMGGESSMAGASFFAASAAGGSMIDNGLYEGKNQEQRSAQDSNGEARASRRRRSASVVAGERGSGAPLARSPVRRSMSVYSERGVDSLERSSSGTAPKVRVGDTVGSSGSSRKESTRRTTSSLQRRSHNNGRGELEGPKSQGQALGWIGGGHTWGASDQEHANMQVTSPFSARRSSRPNSQQSGQALRHPAPIRTSVHSKRNSMRAQHSVSDYEDHNGRGDDSHMSGSAMYAQLSSRQASGREELMDEGDSPHASMLSARSQRGSLHVRHESVRSGSEHLARPGGSYSAMSAVDYESNSSRVEPPLAPGMRLMRGINSRDSDSMRGQSPRRTPATPGSVRSVGTTNLSSKGEGRTIQDKVRQMQHALEKAASAMRQLQEDRKADSSELSDFAKCMDAMTERMDIMDRAMQKVVDDSAEAAQRSVADHEARDDIEKLVESVAALGTQSDELKRWIRRTDGKVSDCWGQLEDLAMRVGGETRNGDMDGLAGVMEGLEATVAEMKKELKALQERQPSLGRTSRSPSPRQDSMFVQASLAEMKEEIKVVMEGQRQTEQQAARALQEVQSRATEAPRALAVPPATDAEVSAQQLEQVSQKAQSAEAAVASVTSEMRGMKGTLAQVQEQLGGIQGQWDTVRGQVDEQQQDNKMLWGKLGYTSSALEKLQGAGAGLTADSVQKIAQEVSREVATEAAQCAAREVARDVAKETATLAGTEAAQAAVQESANARNADFGSLSGASTPRAKVATAEVLDRLRDVERKVDLLDDRVGDVAAGAKAYGAVGEVRGMAASSGGSYSPPRTPDATEAPECTKQGSLDLGSEGIAGPVEISAPEREVTASKATLYTNVYSGPLQNKEFSEFNVQLTEVRSVANAASKDIGHLRGDLEKLKWQLKGSQGETQSAAPGPKTLGSRFDDEAAHSAMEARLKEIQGMTLKADAAREETEETLGMIENRLDQAEHSIQLLQYAVHQHDERIAGLTYSPARNSVSEGSYALKSTVDALESKIMEVEVQYAGRLQAQKAKNDQQAQIIQGLLERVSALEQRERDDKPFE